MIKGLYTGALGLSVLERRQEAAANNLANVNTPGYKKDIVSSGAFSDMLLYQLNNTKNQGNPPKVGNISTGVSISQLYTDQSKGTISKSDSPYSLAIKEDGYFTVKTPQGERYTRNGEFSVDMEGRVVTAEGYPLMGQNGELVIGKGDFKVDQDGTVISNGKEIDKLKIVKFSNANSLTKQGSSLFEGQNPEEVTKPQITQGFVEDSNVDAITEMINMIDIMREYESNQKVIQIIDGTVDKAVNQVGQV